MLKKRQVQLHKSHQSKRGNKRTKNRRSGKKTMKKMLSVCCILSSRLLYGHIGK